MPAPKSGKRRRQFLAVERSARERGATPASAARQAWGAVKKTEERQRRRRKRSSS